MVSLICPRPSGFILIQSCTIVILHFRSTFLQLKHSWLPRSKVIHSSYISLVLNTLPFLYIFCARRALSDRVWLVRRRKVNGMCRAEQSERKLYSIPTSLSSALVKAPHQMVAPLALSDNILKVFISTWTNYLLSSFHTAKVTFDRNNVLTLGGSKVHIKDNNSNVILLCRCSVCIQASILPGVQMSRSRSLFGCMKKKRKRKKKKESWLQLNRITPYKSFRAYEAEQIGPLSNSRNINKCLIQRDEGSKNEQSKKFPLRIINIFHKDAQVKSKWFMWKKKQKTIAFLWEPPHNFFFFLLI